MGKSHSPTIFIVFERFADKRCLLNALQIMSLAAYASETNKYPKEKF